MPNPWISVAAAALLAFPTPAQDRSPARQGDGPKNLVATAKAQGKFETLLAAATAAGLAEALGGDGPLTVFAPTDEAFAKLGAQTLADLLRPENKERLVAILKQHVIAGRVDAVAALRAGRATTLGGTSLEIRLEGGRLRVAGANVVANDVAASNGLIHVIDAVLLPPAATQVPDDPRAAAVQVLETAVERGAPRFNDGDPKVCVELYDLALLAVLGIGRDLLDAETRAEVELARREAAGESDPKQQAWRLRRGIDAAYRALDAAGTAEPAAGRRLRPSRG
jgi:uncharacterized surface protein with fasciclin (FAS1) repeats